MSRHRLPLRVRLVAGFAAAMLVVLAGAGGFVFWRVRYALDARLDADLAQQATDLRAALAVPVADRAEALHITLGAGRLDQLLYADGTVQSSAGTPHEPLVPPSRLVGARHGPVTFERGGMWSGTGAHLRVTAFPAEGQAPGTVAATAVRPDQRDEALRELLGQLALANLLALAVASAVGYRLARAALAPVERYRAGAEEIAAGATGVRLQVPAGPDDEVTRLGHTLNAMLAAQEDASARQRRFLADASHELRTPLTLLTSEVELALRRPRSPEELEETLRAVAEDTARLTRLADTLLAFESATEATLHQTSVDVGKALEAAARAARGALAPDASRHVLVVPCDLAVGADQMALDRVLANLAENAARHGSGDITLSADVVGGALRFTVHDQGAIPPEFLAEAADRFRRSEEARATPGTGLGLALVDALARAHRGQLRVCSAGHHHSQPTPHAPLAALPCTHPSTGTSVCVLLPPPGTGAPTRGGLVPDIDPDG